MLESGLVGAAEPPAAAESDGSSGPADRSMQILEYLVASIAVIAAIALAFLR